VRYMKFSPNLKTIHRSCIKTKKETEVKSLDKIEILISNGTYNKRYTTVKKAKFSVGEFYDPMDIVQVKYEMLREVQESDMSIGNIVSEFGFSRTAYYNIKESYDKNGMSSLIPEKTGPRHPHKLTSQLQNFIDEYTVAHPKASASEITAAIHGERGVSISKRTIERYISKKKPN